MAISILLGTLFGTMLIGVPIAFGLLASGIAMMYFLGIFDTQIIAQNLINGANSFTLLAVPFFILAGELMNIGGMSIRIVNLATAFVGHIRGGLGFVAIIASVIFAGLSGSAIADTAALGAILIPMMVKEGYDKKLATGLIAGGGIIAPILPPSISLILFGVTAGVSITKLFLAGIVPGLIMGIALLIGWRLLITGMNVEPLPRKSIKERLNALRQSFWALILPIIIIGGLRGGIFTPTEAGVVAAVYALFVGVFIYREIKLDILYKALINAAKITSVVMFLVAAAMVAAWMITIANLPAALISILNPFLNSPTLVVGLIVAFVLVISIAMDVVPIILILTPILMPIITQVGIDPVYFGIVFILSATIGLLLPPVGTVLNVACGVSGISMEEGIKGIWPFLLIHIIVLILLVLFPSIVLVPLEWFT